MSERDGLQRVQVVPFPGTPSALAQGGLLMKAQRAAEFLGISVSDLQELSSNIAPTIPFVRLKPRGDKYWTEDGLRAAVDRLYRDQVPTELLPARLLDAA